MAAYALQTQIIRDDHGHRVIVSAVPNAGEASWLHMVVREARARGLEDAQTRREQLVAEVQAELARRGDQVVGVRVDESH